MDILLSVIYKDNLYSYKIIVSDDKQTLHFYLQSGPDDPKAFKAIKHFVVYVYYGNDKAHTRHYGFTSVMRGHRDFMQAVIDLMDKEIFKT